MSLTTYYSSEYQGLDTFANLLITQNAEYLLNYIYEHQDDSPYHAPEVRVGLSIKILINSKQTYKPEILSCIVDDIETLLSDEVHLKKYQVKQQRVEALTQELSLINKLLDLDDTISLNTLHGKTEEIKLN